AYRTLGRSGFDAFADDANGVFTLKLNAPNSDLLLSLAMPWSSIVCPAGLQDTENLQSNPAGSGPFVMQDARRGDTYTLRARPEYRWGANGASTAGPGVPDRLVLRVIEN